MGGRFLFPVTYCSTGRYLGTGTWYLVPGTCYKKTNDSMNTRYVPYQIVVLAVIIFLIIDRKLKPSTVPKARNNEESSSIKIQFVIINY